MRRLKIGYLTTKDPHDRVIWSGLIHNMYVALGKYAGDVERVGAPLPLPIRLMWHGIHFLRKLFGHRLGIMQSLPLSLAYGWWYGRKIRLGGYDVIFAPIASCELAYLKTSVPVVYLSDATFRAMEQYYYRPDEIGPSIRWQGELMHRRTIQRSDALVFASDWAAGSAIRDYGADPAKVHTVPFGANLAAPPNRDLLASGSSDGVCRLLFVSMDWERKRGQLVYETLQALLAMGVEAELTVVGCTPPREVNHPKVHVIPFLNKNVPSDAHRIEQLYLHADFFVLPTRAECFGVVFCEASAFGLPTISTDTGGVPTAVMEGRNGFLLPLEDGPDAYAKVIAEVWRDPARNAELRRTSRERFEEALNWQSWAESVRGVMEALIAAKS